MVVVADPMPIFRAWLRAVLREDGLTVSEAADLEELETLARRGPFVALIDAALPPWGGFEAAARLKRLTGGRTIVLSFEPTVDGAAAAADAGAVRYMSKAVAAAEFLATVRLELSEAVG